MNDFVLHTESPPLAQCYYLPLWSAASSHKYDTNQPTASLLFCPILFRLSPGPKQDKSRVENNVTHIIKQGCCIREKVYRILRVQSD